MDFCQLLHKAQKNDQSTGSGARFYSTKFEPPKKIKKESKDLSNNIKRFLAKKEAEEQKKREEEQKKKEELLALRAQDKKATRRVNVMLKRTKSANQSVIEDAVDKTHTAVTRAGPEQPDEDDYGYVSQEASALYEKMMEKYSQMPEDSKFDLFKKKVSTNLSSTKDRVKAALEKEREEAMQPHKRKRKKKHEDKEDADGKKTDDDKDSPETLRSSKESKNEFREKEACKTKPRPKLAAPPPMSFTELLKIAAQKQHEPIVIEEKPQEDEKLYTKKQKKELEREREWKERRERRHAEMENRDEKDRKRNGDNNCKSSFNKTASGSSDLKLLEKQLIKPNTNVSEISQEKDRDRLISNKTADKDKDRIPSKQMKFATSTQKSNSDSFRKPLSIDSKSSKLTSSCNDNNNFKNEENKARNENYKQYKTSSSSSKTLQSNSSDKSSIPSKNYDQRPTPSSKNASTLVYHKNGIKQEDKGYKKNAPNGTPSDLLPKSKPKEFPPKDLKPKQFPPPDVRGVKRKQPLTASKGRIIDDDEDEYDSELDDFIDDGPEEGDYSSYIKEIFGYDKSRYKDHDDDVANMESSFAQQMKEEVISTKLGIMEDLEDMKKEEEEKRRKAMMKKKMKR